MINSVNPAGALDSGGPIARQLLIPATGPKAPMEAPEIAIAGQTETRTWPWTYRQEGKRDLRFDLLRGLCVVGMICNHVASDSWARIFSLHNGVLITPAEGFVFISGYIFGMVYRSYSDKSGTGAAVQKALTRSFQIYRLTVVLSLLFAVAMILDGYVAGLGSVQDVPHFILDIVVLHHTVYLVDVLMMYVFLVAFGAVGLWALRSRKLPYLIAISFALWLSYQIDPTWADTLPWAIQHNDMFHLAAWQMPFIFALTLGFHHQAFGAWLSRWRQPALISSAAIFGALVYLVLAKYQDFAWIGDLSAKQSEGPLRLLACLFVFQLARLIVTYLWRPLSVGLSWLLIPLGQNSLYAYAMHIVVIAIIWQPAALIQSSELFSTLIQLGTVLVVWVLIKRRVLFNIVPR